MGSEKELDLDQLFKVTPETFDEVRLLLLETAERKRYKFCRDADMITLRETATFLMMLPSDMRTAILCLAMGFSPVQIEYFARKVRGPGWSRNGVVHKLECTAYMYGLASVSKEAGMNPFHNVRKDHKIAQYGHLGMKRLIEYYETWDPEYICNRFTCLDLSSTPGIGEKTYHWIIYEFGRLGYAPIPEYRSRWKLGRGA